MLVKKVHNSSNVCGFRPFFIGGRRGAHSLCMQDDVTQPVLIGGRTEDDVTQPVYEGGAPLLL